MIGTAPVSYPGRVVFTVVISFLVVCMLGIPVAPQEMRAVPAGYDHPGFFGASLATHLVSPYALHSMIASPAVVLFVFFSSDSSSLYTRGESHPAGLENSELGSSLTRSTDMEALLGSTSLVPESPAWEPLLPNVVSSRFTVFPEWRKRAQQPQPSPTWFRNASTTHEYYLNSPDLTIW